MKDKQKSARLNACSRRGFLKRGAAATACAVGFPYIVPASALGADGRTAPSNRIVLGFIGVGKQGRESHLASLRHHDDVQIVAVSDVESGRLAQCKQIVEESYANKADRASFKGCEAYGDFRDLLAREDIDAVVVATPDHWHATVCILAAKAGKDIYCEKPLTRTIAEGRALVDAVERYGRVFQTGSQQRSEYGGRFRRAAELVRCGAIGELRSIDIGIGGPPETGYHLPAEPVPDTLDWDFWLGPAPWRPYNSELCPLNFSGYPHWRYYRDYAGGSFSDFGAHHFDIAQWAMDMDDSGPVDVIPADGKEHDRLTFVYANGIPMYHGAEADCVFHGTKGKILVSRGFLHAEPESILDTPLGADDVHLGRGRGHREDWLHCIRTRERPIADAEIGHRTSTICQLGNIAFILNRRLKWNPEIERFENDEEANRLLSRPARSPWRL
ncbi:MAG: Gfo/Idh/MocA family oxidoreductase [Candidatus Hydrogenedentes bacterium]|nr:Gfo/Idh/MocA family oxidoreductase [Candidatus Hydrogenedentota bacterium]